MFELILLCIFIYIAAFYCLTATKQQIKVEPIKSFDDYFNDSTFVTYKPNHKE